jgi:hypothetical protein
MVGVGLGNMAGGIYATMAGGYANSGSYAVIPGGLQNQAAGDYSFAAGRRATVDAAHPGTLAFADASDCAFPSEAANEFAVRATGDVRLVSAVDSNGQPIAGVAMPPEETLHGSASRPARHSRSVTASSQARLHLASPVPGIWSQAGTAPVVLGRDLVLLDAHSL